ncbi:MAG: hypothetical protein JXR89_03850 [Deltaproteobacteria bacterium]|nr:hypothetical protein [Deltaproteobacteria bacterium]
MQKKTTLTLILVVLLALIFGSGLPAETEMITATGKVIPLAYDENDAVVVVSIEEADGTYYDIAPEGRGKELLALAEKTIEAQGQLVKDEDGYEMLRIDSYKVLEE